MCVDAKSTIYISPPYERTSVITTLQRVLAVFPHNRMHIPEIAVSSQQMNLTPNQRLCILVVHFSPSIHTHSCIGTYVSNNLSRKDITISDLTIQLQADIKPITAPPRRDFTAHACGGTCPCAAHQRPRSHPRPRHPPRTSVSRSTTSRST